MAEQTIDVLMRMVGQDGPLPAESYTNFAETSDRTMREGFVPGQFCELREFSFAAGIEGSMSKFKKDKDKQEKKKNQQTDPAVERALSAAEKQQNLLQQQYKRARKREKEEIVDMQPVDFTRVMDSASTLLFKSMVECSSLAEISIVKRKASGSENSGDCYLRLDFETVLITRLEWKDNEHIMLESGTFIYRKLTIRYRPQRDDGSLGTPIQSIWTMKSAS